MKVLQLNHVAIYVSDVEISKIFYRDILGLDSLPRPAFSFPGAWFRLGIDQELHLIGIKNIELTLHKSNHFALKIDSIELAESKLLEMQVKYHKGQRPDGIIQLILQDPDGYFIELNNAI